MGMTLPAVAVAPVMALVVNKVELEPLRQIFQFRCIE